MSDVIEKTANTLNTVLKKLSDNINNVRAQKAQALAQATQIDEETMAACKLIMKKFVTPQAAGQILQTVGNLEVLEDLEVEMSTMIASVQNTLATDTLLHETGLQQIANQEALTQPPLPVAGGAVNASPAPAQTEDVPAATPAPAQEVVDGSSVAASETNDGKAP